MQYFWHLVIPLRQPARALRLPDDSNRYNEGCGAEERHPHKVVPEQIWQTPMDGNDAQR